MPSPSPISEPGAEPATQSTQTTPLQRASPVSEDLAEPLVKRVRKEERGDSQSSISEQPAELTPVRRSIDPADLSFHQAAFRQKKSLEGQGCRHPENLYLQDPVECRDRLRSSIVGGRDRNPGQDHTRRRQKRRHLSSCLATVKLLRTGSVHKAGVATMRAT